MTEAQAQATAQPEAPQDISLADALRKAFSEDELKRYFLWGKGKDDAETLKWEKIEEYDILYSNFNEPTYTLCFDKRIGESAFHYRKFATLPLRPNPEFRFSLDEACEGIESIIGPLFRTFQETRQMIAFLITHGYKQGGLEYSEGRACEILSWSVRTPIHSQSDLDRFVGDIKAMLDAEMPK